MCESGAKFGISCSLGNSKYITLMQFCHPFNPSTSMFKLQAYADVRLCRMFSLRPTLTVPYKHVQIGFTGYF